MPIVMSYDNLVYYLIIKWRLRPSTLFYRTDIIYAWHIVLYFLFLCLRLESCVCWRPAYIMLCFLFCFSSSGVLCMVVSNTYCVVYFALFVFVLCLVYPTLPVSLDCPIFITPSVSLTFIYDIWVTQIIDIMYKVPDYHSLQQHCSPSIWEDWHFIHVQNTFMTASFQ